MAGEPLLKHFDSPDEVREFEKVRVEVVHLGETTLERRFYQPGWRWSEDSKPRAGTDSCQVHHTGHVVAGSMVIRMDDGHEFEMGPGDAAVVPPGHDGWVVGDEPVEYFEIIRADGS